MTLVGPLARIDLVRRFILRIFCGTKLGANTGGTNLCGRLLCLHGSTPMTAQRRHVQGMNICRFIRDNNNPYRLNFYFSRSLFRGDDFGLRLFSLHVSTQRTAQLRSFKASWFTCSVVSSGRRDLQGMDDLWFWNVAMPEVRTLVYTSFAWARQDDLSNLVLRMGF